MTKDNIPLGKFDLKDIPPAPRGVPQIDVTFEIDANGILNVSAADKGTGNSESITITADKGRPSEDEIEAEDAAMKEKVEAKNSLESMAFNLKNQIEDEEKLAGKLDEDDKTTIEEAVEDVIAWLGDNEDAEAEDFKEKQAEFEEIVNPILKGVYGEGGMGGGGDGGYEDDDDLEDH